MIETPGLRQDTGADAAATPAWSGEAAFEALCAILPGPVLVADAEGAGLWANASWGTRTGRPAEALLGQGWMEAVDARDRDRLAAAWRSALVEGGPREARVRLVSAGGERRWHLWRVTPLRDGGGGPRWIGHATEVQGDRAAEEDGAATGERVARPEGSHEAGDGAPAGVVGSPDPPAGTRAADGRAMLEGLEERLRRLSDPEEAKRVAAEALGRALGAGRVAFAEVDEDRGIVRMGQSATQGAMPDAVGEYRLSTLASALGVWRTGRTLAVADLLAEPRTGAVAVMPAVEATRAVLDVPFVKDGRVVALLSVNHPEPRAWTPEEIALAEAVAARSRAAVEHARALALLRERDTRLEAVADGAGLGTWHWSLATDVFRFGPHWGAMLGYEEAEIPEVAARWESVVHAEDRPALDAAVRDHLEGRTAVYRSEHRLRHKDGRWIWVLDSGRVTERDREGRPLAMAGTHLDITARKEAEEALRQSEARAQDRLAEIEQVYRYAPVGVFAMDRDCRFTRINERMAAINGRPVEDHEGRSIWEVVPELADRLAEIYRPVLERGEPVLGVEIRGETRARPGAKRDFLASYFPLRSGAGDVVGLIGTVLEVTETRRAEERLRLALEGGRLGTWDWNIATGEVSLDERWLGMLGYGPGDLEGRIESVAAITHPEDLPMVQAALCDHLEGRTDGYAAEFRGRRKDGGWLWLSGRGHVHERDAEGRPLRMAGVQIDITERRAAQAALASSEARWRGLFEHMHEGVGLGEILRDEQGRAVDLRFLEVNAGFGRQSNLPHSVVGQRLTEAVPGIETHWIEFYARVAETGEPAQVEYHAAPLGRWFEARAHRTGPDRFASLFLDITARRKAEAALAKSQERLVRLNAELEARVAQRTASLAEAARALEAEMRRREEAQGRLVQAQKMEALGQLVGGVAHDFNNILAAVQGAFAMLDRRVGDERLRLVIGEGRKAGERATALVRQMLAFARRERLEPQVIEPSELLPGLVSMIHHAAGPRVECGIEVSAGVWSVLADPQQLEVALLNLAVNARDAMPEGGALTLSARNLPAGEPRPAELGEGDHVAIAMADTGHGMDAVTVARAPEPFFTTKAVGQGTGLGLAQVHGFVQGSGGAMRIDSAPGQGTTVTLFLPRSAVLATAAPATPADPADRHGNASILLVDDDEQVRPITAALLRDLGYSVVEAPSGPAALALAQLHPVDLLLSDVVMPGMDGPALADALRAERPGLPVLFFTGYAGRHRLDGEAVLTKPFTEEELGRRVLDRLGRGEAAPRSLG